MGIGGFFRDRKRKRILEQEFFEPEMWQRVFGGQRLVAGLTSDEAQRLRDLCTILIAEKQFEFVGGLQFDMRIVLTIAIQACLPILNLGIDWYNDWHTFIVTPGSYEETRRRVESTGLTHEWEEEVSGQVLELGPVVLSWQDVRMSSGDYQVVIHEMAHKLDLKSGEMNGMPPLPPEIRTAWVDGFTKAYNGVLDLLAQSRTGSRPPRKSFGHGPARPRRLPLDPYAAEGPEEFFAVACETFFGNPLALKHRLPVIYALLCAFFRQDPISR